MCGQHAFKVASTEPTLHVSGAWLLCMLVGLHSSSLLRLCMAHESQTGFSAARHVCATRSSAHHAQLASLFAEQDFRGTNEDEDLVCVCVQA